MFNHIILLAKIPCRGLEKSLAKRHDQSTARYVLIKHGRTVLFKWERQSKSLATRHGRRTARYV